MDVAVHALDALDFILGEISEARGFYENQAGLYVPEDIVCASFRFKSGVVGTGLWCFTAGKETDTIEIVGDRGKITFGCHSEEPILLDSVDGWSAFAMPNPEHVAQGLIQSIVDELNGTDTCPSTLETALRTAKVCDMIYGRI
jgi:predicted dehydrogenase